MSTPEPSEFQAIFSEVWFVGSTDVIHHSSSQTVIQAMRNFTELRSPRHVPETDIAQVDFIIDQTHVKCTAHSSCKKDLPTAPLREVSYCCCGPVSSQLARYFGFVSTNYIGGMPLGFVCHVFRTRSKGSAEDVIKAMGHAFRVIRETAYTDNSSVSGRSLESGDSVISQTSASLSSQRSGPKAASIDSFNDSCVTPSPEEGNSVSEVGPSKAPEGAHTRSHHQQLKTAAAFSGKGHRRSRSEGSPWMVARTPSTASVTSKAQPYTSSSLQVLEHRAARIHARLRALSMLKVHKDEEGQRHARSFTGDAIVTWLVSQKEVESRSEAVQFMQTLLTHGVIDAVGTNQVPEFRDSSRLYAFAADVRRENRRKRQQLGLTPTQSWQRRRGRIRVSSWHAADSSPAGGAAEVLADGRQGKATAAAPVHPLQQQQQPPPPEQGEEELSLHVPSKRPLVNKLVACIQGDNCDALINLLPHALSGYAAEHDAAADSQQGEHQQQQGEQSREQEQEQPEQQGQSKQGCGDGEPEEAVKRTSSSSSISISTGLPMESPETPEAAADAAPQEQLMSQLLYLSLSADAKQCTQHLLAEQGLDVNAPLNQEGDTPLHRAAACNNKAVALKLLQQGADVNATNDSGCTPLFFAAEKTENHECSILLVENGACVRAVNADGKRPIDLQPPLADAQRFLCQSIGDNLLQGSDAIASLHTLARLSTNAETHALLCDELQKEAVLSALRALCQRDAEASALVQDYVHNSTALTGRGLLDEDILKTVLTLLHVGGEVQETCLHSLLTGLHAFPEQDIDFLVSLSRLDFLPLFRIVCRREESKQVQTDLAALLVLLTRLPKARRRLCADEGNLTALLDAIKAQLEALANEDADRGAGSDGVTAMTTGLAAQNSAFAPCEEEVPPADAANGAVDPDATEKQGEQIQTEQGKQGMWLHVNGDGDDDDATAAATGHGSSRRSSAAGAEPLLAPITAGLLSNLVSILTNLCVDLSTQRVLERLGVSGLLGNLLAQSHPAIHDQAVLALILLGHHDAGDVEMLIPLPDASHTAISSDDVIISAAYANDAEEGADATGRRSSDARSRSDTGIAERTNSSSSESTEAPRLLRALQLAPPGVWQHVRAGSLLTCVSLLLHHCASTISSMASLLMVHQHHDPLIVLRLLVHTFRRRSAMSSHALTACGHRGLGLTPVHARVVRLLRAWLLTVQPLLADRDDLGHETEDFLSHMQLLGGPYEAEAQQLYRLLEPQALVACGSMPRALDATRHQSSYAGAPHNALYDTAREHVVSGQIPIPKDIAVALAAMQLVVEEAARRKLPAHRRVVTDATPAFKLKAIMPPAFVRARDVSGLIKTEFRNLPMQSERDAKHTYLHLYNLSVAHDCVYFNVKQTTDAKRRVPRTLGISPEYVFVIDAKTKRVLNTYSVVTLRRWERTADRSSRFLFAVGKSSKQGTFIFFFADTELVVHADNALLQDISSTLMEKIKQHPALGPLNDAAKHHLFPESQGSQGAVRPPRTLVLAPSDPCATAERHVAHGSARRSTICSRPTGTPATSATRRRSGPGRGVGGGLAEQPIQKGCAGFADGGGNANSRAALGRKAGADSRSGGGGGGGTGNSGGSMGRNTGSVVGTLLRGARSGTWAQGSGPPSLQRGARPGSGRSQAETLDDASDLDLDMFTPADQVHSTQHKQQSRQGGPPGNARAAKESSSTAEGAIKEQCAVGQSPLAPQHDAPLSSPFRGRVQSEASSSHHQRSSANHNNSVHRKPSHRADSDGPASAASPPVRSPLSQQLSALLTSPRPQLESSLHSTSTADSSIASPRPGTPVYTLRHSPIASRTNSRAQSPTTASGPSTPRAVRRHSTSMQRRAKQQLGSGGGGGDVVQGGQSPAAFALGPTPRSARVPHAKQPRRATIDGPAKSHLRTTVGSPGLAAPPPSHLSNTSGAAQGRRKDSTDAATVESRDKGFGGTGDLLTPSQLLEQGSPAMPFIGVGAGGAESRSSSRGSPSKSAVARRTRSRSMSAGSGGSASTVSIVSGKANPRPRARDDSHASAPQHSIRNGHSDGDGRRGRASDASVGDERRRRMSRPSDAAAAQSASVLLVGAASQDGVGKHGNMELLCRGDHPLSASSPLLERRRTQGNAQPRSRSRSRPRSSTQSPVASQPSDAHMCSCPATPALRPGFNVKALTMRALLESPEELARQLTLIEHDLFKDVTVGACFRRMLTPAGPSATSSQPALPSQHDDAVLRFIARFNQVTSWLATIILEEDALEQRCQVIERLLRVAHHCYRLRNYNGVMEIISALGTAAVRRLSDTWDALSAKALETHVRLSTLMAADNNFRQYRALLAESCVPCVPYFGMYLRDLTFLHQGNQDFGRRGMLNVAKMRRLGELLSSMAAYQAGAYNILLVPEIHDYLLGVQGKSEDVLFRRSQKLQPPQLRRTQRSSAARQRSATNTHRPSISRKLSSHNLSFMRSPFSSSK